MHKLFRKIDGSACSMPEIAFPVTGCPPTNRPGSVSTRWAMETIEPLVLHKSVTTAWGARRDEMLVKSARAESTGVASRTRSAPVIASTGLDAT
jgi:hypothetical protein